MQGVEPGDVALADVIDCLCRADLIVGMGHQIAVLEHVDPHLAITHKLVGKGLLDDFAGQFDIDAVVVQVVLHGFPRKLESHFKRLDQGHLDEVVSRGGRIGLNGLAEPLRGGLQVAETLLPADVLFCAHGCILCNGL